MWAVALSVALWSAMADETGEDPAVENSGRDGVVASDGERSFFDVALTQRACRQFTDAPVPDQLVERCLRAATHAPSAENLQPWVFIVVRDNTLREGIGELIARAWRKGGRQHSVGRLDESLLHEVEHGAEGGIASAPVMIVVCGDSSIGLAQTLPSSVFLATQNLLLSASALGLGSAMTTLATLHSDELSGLLDLPDSVRPMAVVPIGWPARPLGPPRRLPLSERAHLDRYGAPWPE
jgi:nitroreductase